MTSTTLIVPLGDVHENPDNPRSHYDEDAMRELVASVKANGLITPIVVWPRANGDGEPDGYVILAGHRRRRAAEQAGLSEVPVHVASAGSWDETGLMVADNVIRVDLTPVEEARAYAAMIRQGKSVSQIAKLTGRAKQTVAHRLNLLVLPDSVVALVDEGRVTLAAAEALVLVAAQDKVLAGLVAAYVAEESLAVQAELVAHPADVIDAVLTLDDAALCTAYSIGGWRDPLLPDTAIGESHAPLVIAKCGGIDTEPGKRVFDALAGLAGIPDPVGEYDYQHKLATRERSCFKLDEQDIDSARAYGCLLELLDEDGDVRWYICDADFLATCIVKRVEEWAQAEPQVWKTHDRAGRSAAARDPHKPKPSPADQEEKRAARDEAYEQRTEGRKRNLELGVKAEQTQFALDLAAAKFLANLLIDRYGEAMVWAHRLCVDQPQTEAKNGRVTVNYPRELSDRVDMVKKLRAKVERAKTPDDAWSVVARLLAVQHLVDTAGLPGADVNAVYEPYELRDNPLVGKLATRAQPASVRKHRAAQARSKRGDAPEGSSSGDAPAAAERPTQTP